MCKALLKGPNCSLVNAVSICLTNFAGEVASSRARIEGSPESGISIFSACSNMPGENMVVSKLSIPQISRLNWTQVLLVQEVRNPLKRKRPFLHASEFLIRR